MLHASPFSLRETERGKNNFKIYLVERETESGVRKKIVVSRKKGKRNKAVYMAALVADGWAGAENLEK